MAARGARKRLWFEQREKPKLRAARGSGITLYSCRLTTYRHRFARAAPADPRIVDVRRPSRYHRENDPFQKIFDRNILKLRGVRPCCREAAVLRGARHAKLETTTDHARMVKANYAWRSNANLVCQTSKTRVRVPCARLDIRTERLAHTMLM